MESLAEYIGGNPLIALAAAFVGGLLSASSPCVLAIMPMVIGFVGGHSAGDRRKAVIYSLLFALGLSITFTVLGMAASLLGRLMGDIGRIWFWVIGGLAVIMGVSMMGFFEIRIPFAVKMQTRKQGALGAFLMGLLFGAVSSPCATPALVVILTFAATQGQIFYGAALLFVYAIGHCALIIAAGIAAGFAQSYIQSKSAQGFSIWAKRISGGLISIAGIYVIYLNM